MQCGKDQGICEEGIWDGNLKKKLEVRSRQTEVRSRQTEVGSGKMEDGSQKQGSLETCSSPKNKKILIFSPFRRDVWRKAPISIGSGRKDREVKEPVPIAASGGIQGD